MIVYEGEKLEKYIEEDLQIQSSWEKRDFTGRVKSYLDCRVEKVLAVSGLRGTGKTVGVLQVVRDYNAAYILAQKGDDKTGKDYIDFLKQTDKKYIIIDEYSWIEDRKDLDYYLLTSVQNGKRIILAATESITLDFLNYGALCHRVDVVHTTMMPYGEYLRLFHKEHSKAVCRQYLLEGGVFQQYAITNFESMKAYIENAIVQNLAGYLKNEMSEEKARTLTYSVLYKAICPSNLSSVSTLRKNHVTLNSFLEEMGVNTTILPRERELNRVAEIFEQAGIIVRIPNYVRDNELKEQYYVVNPSLTCQLIKTVYALENLESSVLGHVFESVVAVQLVTNKLEDHDIYFYNNGNEKNNPNNKELDIILTDKEREFAYFFECKFSANDNVDSGITLLSGYLEEHEFKNVDIEGRYIIYNGKPCVKDEYKVGTVIFTPIGDMLDNYFMFAENVKNIRKSQKEKLQKGEYLDNCDFFSEEEER